MSKDPYFRFFPSDWLTGVADLSLQESGLYINILALIYDRGGPIPYDPGRLAKRFNTKPTWVQRTVEHLVSEEKLALIDGQLKSKRAELELHWRASASEAGTTGAKKRWGKRNKNKGSDDATAMQSHQNRNANQKPEASAYKRQKPKGFALNDQLVWIPEHESSYTRWKAHCDKTGTPFPKYQPHDHSWGGWFPSKEPPKPAEVIPIDRAVGE